MYWQESPYVLTLLIAAATSAAVAALAWRRRPSTGAMPLFWVMAAVACWSLAYALELMSADSASKVFWLKVEYLGIPTVPIAWLLLVLDYTGRQKWLTRRNQFLLAIVPSITMLLAWTNDAHGLIYRHISLDTSGSFPELALTYGVWFWISIAYSYLAVFLGTLLLLQSFLHASGLYRGQVGAMLIAVSAPWLANVLHLSGLSPFPNLDLTPLAFTLTGLATGWALFRFRLLDIVPVARDAVIESMGDGVIVLDKQDRIVDLNPAAGSIIGIPISEVIGRPAAQALSDWADLTRRYRDVMEAHEEITLGVGDLQRTFDLRISPLSDRRGCPSGRLVALRDVTARKRVEEALLQRTRQLELLNRAGRLFNSTLDLDQILDTVLEEVRRLLDVTICSIWLLDPVTQELVCQQASDPKSELIRGWRLPPRKGIASWAVHTCDSLIVPDAQTDERHYKEIDRLTGLTTRSVVAVPLVLKGGVIGVLEVLDERADLFGLIDLALLEPLAASAAIAIENARLYEQTQQEIAQRKQAEEERERLIADLDAYAHTVAHDLKNPLALILGYIALIEESGSGLPFEELRDYLSIIAKTSLKMRNIIEELLLLAGVRKLERLAIDRLDMASIVSDALSYLSGIIARADAEVAVPSKWPEAQGYAPWVKEVWANYISNAVKYGGLPPRVELGADDAGGEMVRFWVRDNGRGLGEGEKARLFTRFSRLDQTRAEGHGLGLSIVRRIVEELGGQVGVESEVGAGCAFFFTLPAAGS
jgi:PAS domain S-box-containing protein